MRWGRVEITAGALLLWALLYYLDSGGMVPQVLRPVPSMSWATTPPSACWAAGLPG